MSFCENFEENFKLYAVGWDLSSPALTISLISLSFSLEWTYSSFRRLVDLTLPSLESPWSLLSLSYSRLISVFFFCSSLTRLPEVGTSIELRIASLALLSLGMALFSL